MGEKYRIDFDATKFVTINGKSHELYEIEALRNIPSIGVRVGDRGGHVSTQNSLSQDGDCWVFQGSTVYQQGRVLENAVIYGNSVVATGSQVKGKAMVEDGLIFDESMVEDEVSIQKSTVKRSLLSGTIGIQESKLLDVVAKSGHIFKSTLISHGGTLTIKKNLTMEGCELEISDANPVIEVDGNLQLVTAKNLEIFRLKGTFDIQDATFEGKTRLTVVENEVPNDKTVIQNTDGECTFMDADLCLSNSTIKGAVHVSGKVVLRNSELLDMATVRNDSTASLLLTNVRVMELALVWKHLSRTSIIIEGNQIGADTQLNF